MVSLTMLLFINICYEISVLVLLIPLFLYGFFVGIYEKFLMYSVSLLLKHKIPRKKLNNLILYLGFCKDSNLRPLEEEAYKICVGYINFTLNIKYENTVIRKKIWILNIISFVVEIWLKTSKLTKNKYDISSLLFIVSWSETTDTYVTCWYNDVLIPLLDLMTPHLTPIHYGATMDMIRYRWSAPCSLQRWYNKLWNRLRWGYYGCILLI